MIKTTNQYKWNGSTARRVITRFCLADAKLTHRHDDNQMADKHRDVCAVVDELIDRFKVDINGDMFNDGLAKHKMRDKPAGYLLNSCISIIGTRKPVAGER